MNEHMTREEREAWANHEYMMGRYCIGCQAVGVETNAHGYCVSCVAGYDALHQKIKALNEAATKDKQ